MADGDAMPGTMVAVPVDGRSFATRVEVEELTGGLELRVPTPEWVVNESLALFRLEQARDWERLLHRLLGLVNWPTALLLVKDRLRRLKRTAQRVRRPRARAEAKAKAKGKAKAKAKQRIFEMQPDWDGDEDLI